MLALRYGLYLHHPLIYGMDNDPTSVAIRSTVELLSLCGVLCGGAGVPEGFPEGAPLSPRRFTIPGAIREMNGDILQPKQPENRRSLSSSLAIYHPYTHTHLFHHYGCMLCLLHGTICQRLQRMTIQNYFGLCALFSFYDCWLLLFHVFSFLFQWPGASLLYDYTAWDGWNWWVRRVAWCDLFLYELHSVCVVSQSLIK